MIFDINNGEIIQFCSELRQFGAFIRVFSPTNKHERQQQNIHISKHQLILEICLNILFNPNKSTKLSQFTAELYYLATGWDSQFQLGR
jgi:hypothetical protein